MTRPGQDLVCDLPENASLLGHDVLGALRALRGPRERDEEDGVCGEDADVEEELEEVLLVPLADAVVDPGAVVVHLLDAAAALAAVVRTRNLEPAANLQNVSVFFPI